MNSKCYSLNDEEFDFNKFGDLLAQMDDPKVGDTYFEADYKPLTYGTCERHTMTITYSQRVYNRAADAPKKTRIDCTDVAAEADKEIHELRAALTAAETRLREIEVQVNALLHQIDIGDFVDGHGHSAKMLAPVHSLMKLIGENHG